MLEMSYVARSCGVTDAMLPLSLIDTTITMTVKTCAWAMGALRET